MDLLQRRGGNFDDWRTYLFLKKCEKFSDLLLFCIDFQDLLDSRRNSRQSCCPSNGNAQYLHTGEQGREVRSCSLGAGTNMPPNMFLLPGQHGHRTNLSRQTSISDGGGRICPGSRYLQYLFKKFDLLHQDTKSYITESFFVEFVLVCQKQTLSSS